MKKFIILFLFAALGGNISFSQDFRNDNPKLLQHVLLVKKQGAVTDLSNYNYLKKPGYYTTEDWHALIDSFWGPGAPTATKLAIFDEFWNLVDQYYGGFPNLYVNWDSLKDVYRPIVEAGVSCGRFAGILSRLTSALQERHTGVYDRSIDSTFGKYDYNLKANEYPNYPSFHYLQGIPIININSAMFRTNFGAGLTMLPDSSILVYSVMPNHPLGLQPGDLILGYDGIPWRQQLDELLKAELPILAAYCFGTNLGSSLSASAHTAMMSAGLNWGLFDTIDVVKYPTNDTLHYLTSLLSSITPPYYIATEQLPVGGVSFPDIQGNKLLSWGIIEETKIGYIYVWDWLGIPWGQTRILFEQAVDTLMHIKKVSGLILDFRTNPGGWPELANDGFKHLFNMDPTDNYSAAIRTNENDHYSFTLHPIDYDWPELHFTPTSELFDHPIAVLLGPNCVSSGDYNAFRLRFHPMVRFFGKPTNGGYTTGTNDFVEGFKSIGTYAWRIDNGCVYSNVNNEGYMIHKSFPVDEEVWLTRDGVAKGEDDVVNKALEWINNLSYAHTVTLNKTFLKPSIDTLVISTIVENPNSHVLSVYSKIAGLDKVPVDSIPLFDDGGHSDANPGDGIWGALWPVPSGENLYAVNITTEDTAAGSIRKLPSVVRFTSSGPVVFYGITCDDKDTVPNPGDNIYFKVTLRNNGLVASAFNVKAELTSLDTLLALIPVNSSIRPFADIAPGELSTNSNFYRIAISEDCPANTAIPVKVDIKSDEYTFWSDTFSIFVREPLGIEDISESMTRIYPNPTENILNIELNNADNQPLEIEIYTVTGEIIYQKDYKNIAAHFVEQVDLSGYTKGIYLVKVKQEFDVRIEKLIVY